MQSTASFTDFQFAHLIIYMVIYMVFVLRNLLYVQMGPPHIHK